jgi:hypothetical protein
MTRAVTLPLAAVLVGTASVILRAQTPAARPVASSKTLIDASLGDTAEGDDDVAAGA